MKYSIKFGLMGGMILFCLSMSLTSCEGALDDILGEWSRPTPGGNVTPGGGSSSGASSSSSSNCGNLTEKGYPSSRDQNQGVSPAGTLAERGYPCSTTGYNPSAPSNKQDAKIYAVDYPSSNDGRPDHFVNDIGNGQYFDPATGKTGYVSDLQLATEGLGGTRELRYHDK